MTGRLIVDKIESPSELTISSAGNTAITVDTDGNVGIGTSSPSEKLTVTGNFSLNGNNISAENGFSFRNRIINGDMRIDQRYEGTAATINTENNYTYVVDRWNGYGTSSDGVFTLQRSATAPSGFSNSLLATVITADASISAFQFYIFEQFIEGYNIDDLAWGTANAQSVTLSFWVRSSVTGTFSGSVANNAYDRSYPFTFVINSANTFEYKTVTIPGDTTGTWLTDNGIGIRLYFDLGSGSSNKGTAGAWAGVGYTGATGSVNLISTLNATFYITGVQLEVGTVATPFERRPYATEFSLCERYFQKIGGKKAEHYGSGEFDILTDYEWYTSNGTVLPLHVSSNGTYFVNGKFHTTMRTAPTFITSLSAATYSTTPIDGLKWNMRDWYVADKNLGTISLQYESYGREWTLSLGTVSSGTASVLHWHINSEAYLYFDAEL
jgi:hypothetical protein